VLLDLNAMSKLFYEAPGPERSRRVFVYYPTVTFAGQDDEFKDDAHFNPYGAYKLARCVVKGIRAGRLGIVRFVVEDLPPFDPSYPDLVEGWRLPASPQRAGAFPNGEQ
jgi:hypothetical protein